MQGRKGVEAVWIRCLYGQDPVLVEHRKACRI